MDAFATAQKKFADHLDRLVRAINEIGINFHMWNDGSGAPQYTSLSGNDYKRLCDTLPPKLLFAVNNDTYDNTVFLMRELLSIHKLITNSFTNKSDAFSRIKPWMERFTGLNDKQRVGYNRVTPYMRCLLYHVPKFASLYNGIGSFSGQGVEINDQIKFIHQKRSNKSDQTVDELKTRKRMEYLKDINCERSKQKYNKVNENYWGNDIKEKHCIKKRRINFEIEEVHKQYEEENEKSPDKMTTAEIKQKLKTLGTVTKVRS